jgi:hypothetical protein
MSKDLFLRIAPDVTNHSCYFQQRRDAVGNLGLHPVQKIFAAWHYLCYGTSADLFDESFQLAKSTILEAKDHLCTAIVELYGAEYLRDPNLADVIRLYEQNERRGFPGMLGSLDWIHWEWKKCPTAHDGQYKGKEKGPTIDLEAIADKDLWIRHAYFGSPGSLNDLNILDRSTLQATDLCYT